MASSAKSVLIVEDDFALSDAFGMILTTSGYEVHLSHNGKEALEYLDGHLPDVILLDILMPVMDGRDFLRAFKNEHHIPVVALSNLDAKRDIEEVLRLGATNYMLKSSVTPDKLTTLVHESIN